MDEFTIKENEYIKDEYSSYIYKNKKEHYQYGKLKLHIKGLPYQILAPIRKVAINQIPIYAFPNEKINITKNTSAFDNTYLRNHLSQLPIPNLNEYLEKQITLLSPDYYEHVNFADPKRDKHPDDTIEIEYFIKGKNTGDDKIKYITTNDMDIMINNNKITKLYNEKHPFTLIQLRPNEEFECSMKAVLAIGELNAIFNASNCYYKQNSEFDFDFMISSSWQYPEYDLLIKSCDILIEKLNIIKKNYSNYNNVMNTENNSQCVIIDDGDYICGNPINYFLQSDKDIMFSGISRINFIEKKIKFVFKGKDKVDLTKKFNKAVDDSINLYTNIKKQLNKLNKKL